MTQKTADTQADAKILPHFKVVTLEETEHWSEELRAKAGRIFRTYLFDANRHVHCCEITPSYELHPISTHALNDDEEGSTEEELRQHEDNDVMYVHVRNLDAMPASHFHDLGVESDAGKSHEEVLEAQMEYCKGNSVLEFPSDVVVPERTAMA